MPFVVLELSFKVGCVTWEKCNKGSNCQKSTGESAVNPVIRLPVLNICYIYLHGRMHASQELAFWKLRRKLDVKNSKSGNLTKNSLLLEQEVAKNSI